MVLMKSVLGSGLTLYIPISVWSEFQKSSMEAK